ncbi:hypothetical protein F3D3_0069 [Fusibacter sp. 3D3]|nr:hypothetical protein F3D3_0069 [Fusibacter sp. 3D3]
MGATPFLRAFIILEASVAWIFRINTSNATIISCYKGIRKALSKKE